MIGQRNYIGLFLLYAVLACSFLAPIASNEVIPSTLDLWTHTNLLVQGELALTEGQFPIRVAPTEHEGLGYPEFQFYSPLTYTVAGYIYKIFTPGNPYLALKITIWLALIIAAFYTYRLAAQLTNDDIAAMLAGAAYMAAPYLLINILARGDITEAIGQCIIPVILYYNFQINSKKKIINNMFIAGLMWSVLAMIHLITFVNASITIAFFFFFLKSESHLKKLVYLSLAYSYGFLLAAWYLAPAIFYHSLLNISNTLTDPAYYNYFTLLPRLCSTVAISIFSILGYSKTGYDTILSPPFYASVGLVTLISVSLCAYVALNKAGKFKYVDKRLLRLLLAMFFITIFITWSPFSFWNYLPKILVIEQFSYRFLAQVVWIGILLIALAIKIFTNGKNSMQTLILGLVIICFSSNSWLMAEYGHATPVANIVSGSLRNYVKAYFMKLSPILNKENNLESLIMDHTTVRSHCNKIGDKLNCRLSTSTGGLFELPVIFYPDLLSVEVDNKKASYLPIRFEDSYLTGLKLSSGVHNIIIKFTGLNWANWISLIAWFVLIGMGVIHLIRRLFKKLYFVNEMDLI